MSILYFLLLLFVKLVEVHLMPLTFRWFCPSSLSQNLGQLSGMVLFVGIGRNLILSRVLSLNKYYGTIFGISYLLKAEVSTKNQFSGLRKKRKKKVLLFVSLVSFIQFHIETFVRSYAIWLDPIFFRVG